MIEDNPGAENICIQSDQVWLEGVDEESGPVSVDVHAVLLQQLLLVSPALRPVLRQLLHLRRRRWMKTMKEDNFERGVGTRMSNYLWSGR